MAGVNEVCESWQLIITTIDKSRLYFMSNILSAVRLLQLFSKTFRSYAFRQVRFTSPVVSSTLELVGVLGIELQFRYQKLI